MSALGIAGISGVTLVRFIAGVVWNNILGIVGFAALVCAAVIFRRNTQAHKRLMLLASIYVLGPALARIARLPGFGGESGPLVPMVLLGLLATVIVYDVVIRRRRHVATVAGIATIVATFAIAQVIAGQPFDQAFVRALE